MASLTIRPARPEDASFVARVHVESWRAAYVGILPESVLQALSLEKRAAFWRKTLSASVRTSITLVACGSDGGIVGFADGGKERSGDLPCDGELYAIYLLPAAQRKGAGTRLIRQFMRELASAGFQSMAVWVLRSNPSRKFYEALGGEIISPRTIERGGRPYEEVACGWKTW